MLDRQSTWALFRVVQEGLTNIRKHAHATHVSITLDFKLASVRLVVRDNGCGTTSIDGGMGIVGMRERVQSLGGTFMLYTSPDEGFVIDVEVPI
jgi:signal transduction histidine kinase